MPIKYAERLKLPFEGSNGVIFTTLNGLEIATGYKQVIFGGKHPYIEFSENQINKENIFIPDSQKWRIKNSNSNYIEYRSKDYCNVKIVQWKNSENFKKGMFYISPFDLRSDQIPVLIERLYRRGTLPNQDVVCS